MESILPQVTVIMINSRNNDFVTLARDSVKEQYYPYIEYIEEENFDKSRTIGKCWNDAIKKATSDYCLFISDDDYITPDYVLSIISAYLQIIKIDKDLVGATSHLTAFDEVTGDREQLNVYPTGMFTTKHLKEVPFDETLLKYVDTEYYKKLVDKKIFNVYWQYGYHYRQHDGMVSGRTLKMKEIIKERDAHQIVERSEDVKTEK